MRLRTLATTAVAVVLSATGPTNIPAPSAQPRHCVLRLAATDARISCDDGTGRAAAVRAGVVVGILYENASFSGGTLTFTAPSGCTGSLADVDFEVPNLDLPSGWRWYRSFAGCWAKHYQQPYFAGGSVGWNGAGELPWTPRSIRWS
ncbi:hypothetical protein AB0J90_06470 [Micromonospora sp. NPDC049523]|uniref:hypothetical protein n=1 Tax=Micromonospora sp. NPDC049523 TaxID=3155921 RepID=UPI00343CA512